MFLSDENGTTEDHAGETTRVNLVLAAAPGTDQSALARVAHEIRELYDAHLMSAHAGGESAHQFEGLRVAHTVGGGGPSAHMVLRSAHVFLYTLSPGDSLQSIVQEKTESWIAAAQSPHAEDLAFSQLLHDQRVHAVFYFLDPFESEMHRSDKIVRELDAVAQVATIIPVLVGKLQDDDALWQGQRQQALEFFRMVHDVARNMRTSVWGRRPLPEGAVLCAAAHQGSGPNAIEPSDILEVLLSEAEEQQRQAFANEGEHIHCADVFDLCTDVDTLHVLLSIADTKCARRCSSRQPWTIQVFDRAYWPVYMLLLCAVLALFWHVGRMCAVAGLGKDIGQCMAVATQDWVCAICPPPPAACPLLPQCPDSDYALELEACHREAKEALDRCEGELAQTRKTAKDARGKSERTCEDKLDRMSLQTAEQIAERDEQLRECREGLEDLRAKA